MLLAGGVAPPVADDVPNTATLGNRIETGQVCITAAGEGGILEE